MSESCGICDRVGHDETSCPSLDEAASNDDGLDEEVERRLEEEIERSIERATEQALEEQLQRRGRGKKKSTGLPEVKITAALADAIDEAEEAMRSDKDVYARDHKLVRLIRPIRAGEMSSLHPVELPTLRERLTNVAEFKKFDGRSKEYVRCLPSDSLVSGLLARGAWPRLRTLVGIVEAPFMRPDGTVCQTPGFDPTTGYEFVPAPGCKFDPIPERPTQEDARQAYAYVAHELYGDFMFPEAHRSIPIAAILTLLARPAIDGSTPVFLFDGNVPGVGKSLVTDVIATLLIGHPMPRMNYPTAEEETEKVLAGYAVAGVPFMCFDNIASAFGGSALDRVTTAKDTVQLRVLGLTKIQTLTWYAVIFGTGNNIELQGDMAPRVLIARQESNMEDPRTRTGFRHPDLLAWALTNRHRLVSSLLTILRAYVVANRPNPALWGSFESWSSLIPGALVYAGAPDPLGGRIKEPAAASEDHRQIVAIMNLWPRLVGRASEIELEAWKRDQDRAASDLFGEPRPTPRWGIMASEAISLLYDSGATTSQFTPLREAIETLCCPKRASGEVRPTPTALSGKLRIFKKRVVGGRRFMSEMNTHTKIDIWTVEDMTTGEPLIEAVGIERPKMAPVVPIRKEPEPLDRNKDEDDPDKNT